MRHDGEQTVFGGVEMGKFLGASLAGLRQTVPDKGDEEQERSDDGQNDDIHPVALRFFLLHGQGVFFLLRGITHLIVADKLLLVLVEDGVFHHHAPLVIFQCQFGISLTLSLICTFKRFLQELVEMVLIRHGNRLGEIAFLDIDTGFQKCLAVFLRDAQGLIHQNGTLVVAPNDMIGLRQGHQPVDDLMWRVHVFP